MKFTVKDMDIATGGVLIANLNQKDALKLDLHHGDRIKIYKGNKVETVVMNIAESEKAVPQGKIGLFEEVLKALNVKEGDRVKIMPAMTPISIEYIKKKLDGKKLTKKEIEQIVWDIVHNKLTDTELGFFVSACYTNVMTDDETVLLTRAMAKEGDFLNLGRKTVDKHCIGGVAGNRTTMLIVPIVAAAGLTIPKTSSRSITSPAGTADTMEVLCKVSFPIKKIKEIVKKHKACIVWGGAINLAPADDRIIRVERPLAIDAESQLIASILAKKASVNAKYVLIDIPVSEEAKITSLARAKVLRKRFVKIGKKLGMKINVIITDGSQPIGNGIGPALEARDVLYVLERDKRRPLDLEKKSLMMAGLLLKMAGIKEGFKKAREIINKGLALKKMRDIIKAQGGNPDIKSDDITLGKFKKVFRANKTGVVKDVNNKNVCKIARLLGAPLAKEAGIYICKHEGDNVKKGDILFELYSNSKKRLNYVISILKKFPIVKV